MSSGAQQLRKQIGPIFVRCDRGVGRLRELPLRGVTEERVSVRGRVEATDDADAEGASILGLMMLGAAKGDTIEIVVSGEEAEVALTKLVGLVKDGFGED